MEPGTLTLMLFNAIIAPLADPTKVSAGRGSMPVKTNEQQHVKPLQQTHGQLGPPVADIHKVGHREASAERRAAGVTRYKLRHALSRRRGRWDPTLARLANICTVLGLELALGLAIGARYH